MQSKKTGVNSHKLQQSGKALDWLLWKALQNPPSLEVFKPEQLPEIIKLEVIFIINIRNREEGEQGMCGTTSQGFWVLTACDYPGQKS